MGRTTKHLRGIGRVLASRSRAARSTMTTSRALATAAGTKPGTTAAPPRRGRRERAAARRRAPAPTTRVQLCGDRACTDVIETIDVVGTTAIPEMTPPAGVAFWRVIGRTLVARTFTDNADAWLFSGVAPGCATITPRALPFTGTFTVRAGDVARDGFDDLIGVVPCQVQVFFGGPQGLHATPDQTIAVPQ